MSGGQRADAASPAGSQPVLGWDLVGLVIGWREAIITNTKGFGTRGRLYNGEITSD